jgi:hypothetical protein
MKLPNVVLSICLIGALAGPASAGQFDGTWVLTQVGGQPVKTPEPPYFTLHGHEVSGFDGCVRFSGRIDVPKGIMFSEAPCQQGAVMLPFSLRRLPEALGQAWAKNGILHIPAGDGYPASRFTAR